MDQLRDLLDALLPQPERVRRGDHDGGDGLVQLLLDRRAVQRAVGGGRDLRDGEARHRGGRRVRAVRRVRDEDAASRLELASIFEGARDHQHAGQLALRAGGGREADRGQAGDLGEAAPQLKQEAQRPLRVLRRRLRMRGREARQRRHEVVDLRVVLHRAGAQRVGAGVDAVVPRGERRVVAHESALAQLRQPHRVAQQTGVRQRRLVPLPRGHVDGPAAGRAAVEAQARAEVLAAGLVRTHAPPPISGERLDQRVDVRVGRRFGHGEEQRVARLGLRSRGDIEAGADAERGEPFGERGGRPRGPRTRNSWNHGPRSGTS